MDKNKLTEFVMNEFREKAPAEFSQDPVKLKTFIYTNIDHELLNKLIDEFCEKNPDDFAVLNPLGVSPDNQDTLSSLKYKKIINNAGLSYQAESLMDTLNGN
ncbi:hypothetical protein AGMMS50293_11910 [Spirochaetia bacterium]|nr:hypothetical protein AGMMS50293_11910 [Spirochaetia bacterium]